jgi:hypothetical protein
MRGNLSIYLWGCAFITNLVLAGYLLARLNLITIKNSKRKASLASTLAAACGLWLTEHSKLVLEPTVMDVVAFFTVLWFACFFLFWAGVTFGFRRYGHKHGHDFGESSILSMQYLDSHVPVSDDDQHSNFRPTEIWLPEPPKPSSSQNADGVADDSKVVHIPVKRWNG